MPCINSARHVSNPQQRHCKFHLHEDDALIMLVVLHVPQELYRECDLPYAY